MAHIRYREHITFTVAISLFVCSKDVMHEAYVFSRLPTAQWIRV